MTAASVLLLRTNRCSNKQQSTTILDQTILYYKDCDYNNMLKFSCIVYLLQNYMKNNIKLVYTEYFLMFKFAIVNMVPLLYRNVHKNIFYL